MSQQKSHIHCIKSDFRTARVLALFHHLNLHYSLKFLDKDTYGEDPEFLKLSPFGKTPLLESSLDNFFESNTIIRYISKKYNDGNLSGILPRQEAKIDQWLDFTSSTLDPILDKLYSSKTQQEGLLMLRSVIPMIEKQIASDGYMVGFYPSNADLVIATGILYPFGDLYRENLAQDFPEFTAWLETVSNDFNLSTMHQDFLSFQPESVNDLTFTEGTVNREKRIS